MSSSDIKLKHMGGEPSKQRPSKFSWFVMNSEQNATWSELFIFLRHPFKKGVKGVARNEFGTLVTVSRCLSCGSLYGLIPAYVHDSNVLADDGNCGVPPFCPDYDPSRDLSFIFPDLNESIEVSLGRLPNLLKIPIRFRSPKESKRNHEKMKTALREMGMFDDK